MPDAYHLPPEPGSGFLKVDTTVFERFKAALVSSAYKPPSDDETVIAPVLPYNATNGAGALAVAQQQVLSAITDDEDDEEGTTVLRVIVDTLSMAESTPVRPVWLPPLPTALTLDSVHGREAAGEAADPRHIIALLGLRDVPSEQRQDPLTWDATGADGNLVVVGAPLSGKSTLLRTLISSLALRYAPGQVAFFCVDYGGGQLVPLEALPHVAAVATRSDGDRVRRTISDVHAMLDTREGVLRQHRLDSADALRRGRASGEVPAAIFGDVFLIIDGWGPLREADTDIEDLIVEIAQRGPTLGVHTIVSVSSPNQIRSRMGSSMGGRIELRLTDHFDSQIDRLTAQEMPQDVPGRALVRPKHFIQIALPRVDGIADTEDLGDGVRHLVKQVERRWPAGQVPVVQVLPDIVDLSSVLDSIAALGERRIALGLSERDLSPAYLNLLGGDPHLLVYGDGETGKSTLLRSVVRQLVGRIRHRQRAGRQRQHRHRDGRLPAGQPGPGAEGLPARVQHLGGAHPAGLRRAGRLTEGAAARPGRDTAAAARAVLVGRDGGDPGGGRLRPGHRLRRLPADATAAVLGAGPRPRHPPDRQSAHRRRLPGHLRTGDAAAQRPRPPRACSSPATVWKAAWPTARSPADCR
ncbi:type VII secretion protein EccCb [Fodinicola feengrottensis]|uniref:type VII secretion protein EccCb n=1 Tax=Fodinicola feengrottensis TaxID=435914 RepID=UPI002442B646|nr:type VII secretion protein EccCb [Fodinicola feengrottensis]